MTRIVAVVAALLCIPLGASSQEYNCSFARGTDSVLKDAAFGAYKPSVLDSPLMFKFTFRPKADLKDGLAKAKKDKNESGTRTLSKLLDTACTTGYAGLVTGADGFSWPVIVEKGVRTITFIEVTETGNVMTTTAFVEERTVDGRIPAVHSRHSSVPGGAVTSQYSGACVQARK